MIKSYFRVYIVGATLLATAWFTLPFLWLFRASLSPLSELTQRPPAWLPETVSFDNYRALFEALASVFRSGVSNSFAMPDLIAAGLRNSLIVAGLVTLLNISLGVPAAYALSRFPIRFKETVLLGLMASKMVPAVALIIPLFLVFIRFGIFDSFFGLVLAELSATLPFTIWILKGYIDSVAPELDDAAMVDGASRLQALGHVIAPVSIPGIVASGIFAFMLAWNSFIFPLILTGSSDVMTVQPQLAAAYGVQRAEFGILFAGAIVTAIPPIIVALAIRKYLTSGLLAGSMKG